MLCSSAAERLGIDRAVVLSSAWPSVNTLSHYKNVPLKQPERFRAVLRQAIDMPPPAFAAWSDRVRAFAATRLDDTDACQSHRRPFQDALRSSVE